MNGPTRRRWLGGSLALAAGGALPGCTPLTADALPADLPVRWVGARLERGHRLRERKAGGWPAPALTRRAGALVLGGGVAGLSALRALVRTGVDDAQLLELEDTVGGNARGHVLAGQGCPLGAHYLPVPGPTAHEVGEWLHEIGLLQWDGLRGASRPDERFLCHAPQERLFIDGAWQEGQLPSAAGRPATLDQYRRFARRVAEARRLGFALPTWRAPWTPAHAALDGQTFAAWLAAEGLDDARLRAYLDYACRDDYGAGLDTVSAWAGLHYFASRHGFDAPGEPAEADPGLFTWPEGNGWLTQSLAQPLSERLHVGQTVLAVEEGRQGVTATVWNEAAGRVEAWQAPQAVLALPLFIAARVLVNPPPALGAAVAGARYAPWLVSNLALDEAPLARPGFPPAWDNVGYAPAGSTRCLGYVDATHQRLDPRPVPPVWTVYHALAEADRPALRDQPAAFWLRRVLADLAPLHPDLARRLRAADLMRHGHAMRIPTPGTRGSAALQALRAGRGRLRFAHAELAGYSVFEEAFTLGQQAGQSSLSGGA